MMSDSSEAPCRRHATGMSACSICGTANTHDAGFCRCCGVSITRAGTFIGPVDGAGACGECGCAHAMPARFCDQCGGRLPGYARPPALPDDAVPDIAVTASLGDAAHASAGRPARRNAVPEGAARRRSLTSRYAVPAALAMAVVAAICFSSYSVARQIGHTHVPLANDSSGMTAAADPDAIARPAPHATPPVAATPSMAARPVSDVAARAVELSGFARATMMSLATEFASLAQEPAAGAHSMRGIAHRASPVMTRLVAQPGADGSGAGGASESAARELPSMPVYDLVSILPVDASKN